MANRSQNVSRVVENIITIMKSEPGAPERTRAIEEVVVMAMKADTLDLLERTGMLPEELRYNTATPEGEKTHG